MGAINNHIVEANVKLLDENNVLKDDKRILNLRIQNKDKVINDLLSRIAKLEYEVERLEKRNKEIYEGFMATTEELCEEAKEKERLNNIINELEKWLKFFNENGLVIDLEEGKQTTVMPTLAVLKKMEELKENNK